MNINARCLRYVMKEIKSYHYPLIAGGVGGGSGGMPPAPQTTSGS